MSLTDQDLDRIGERTELAMMKALDRHRREDHGPCEEACVMRVQAVETLARQAAARVDRLAWMGAGALGLLALPWKKLAALFAALRGLP